jgi:hypothetical protein
VHSILYRWNKSNYKMHRPQGSTCGLFLANSVFMNIIKKIVKKLLNNNNSLLCMVKMEYNGIVKKYNRGVDNICYKLKTYQNNIKQEI